MVNLNDLYPNKVAKLLLEITITCFPVCKVCGNGSWFVLRWRLVGAAAACHWTTLLLPAIIHVAWLDITAEHSLLR